MSDDRGDELRPLPETEWPLVERAGEEDEEGPREALGELLRKYLPALRAHLLRAKVVPRDQVEDLLQSFVTDKLLQRDLVASADSRRGKFRSLLLAALHRYIASRRRYEKAQKRSPEVLVSLDAGRPQDLAVDAGPASDPLDAAWACEVLQQTLRRMQQECMASQRADIWGVFEARLVAPAVGGAEPMPYDQLVARYGLSTPRQASNVLGTAKRMFARILRSAIAEYTPEDEIEEEIGQLQRALARSNLQDISW